MTNQSIFHFTKERKTLCSILTDGGFRTATCLEEIELLKFNLKFAMDMVSFSDIGPTTIDSNLNSYGDFVIGLSKTWAKIKRLNPVNYIQSGSTSAELIEPILVETLNSEENPDHRYTIERKGTQVTIQDIYTGERKLKIDLLKGILHFMKNYDGYVVRNGVSIPEPRKHYDDREWRYVPNHEDWKSHRISAPSFIDPNQHMEKRNEAGKKNLSIVVMLKFNANDIDHLIVKKKSDIKFVVEHLKSCKHLFNNEDELKQLINKVYIKSEFLKI